MINVLLPSATCAFGNMTAVICQRPFEAVDLSKGGEPGSGNGEITH